MKIELTDKDYEDRVMTLEKNGSNLEVKIIERQDDGYSMFISLDKHEVSDLINFLNRLVS